MPIGRSAGISLLMGVLVVAVACEREPAVPKTDIENALRAESGEWNQAVEQKDVDAILSYYAPNALVMPYESPLLDRRENIRQLWDELLASPGFELDWTPLAIEVADSRELAYEVGAFDLMVQGAEGEPVIVPGKYVVIWQKQADGSWKAAIDIFNRDEAAE